MNGSCCQISTAPLSTSHSLSTFLSLLLCAIHTSLFPLRLCHCVGCTWPRAETECESRQYCLIVGVAECVCVCVYFEARQSLLPLLPLHCELAAFVCGTQQR